MWARKSAECGEPQRINRGFPGEEGQLRRTNTAVVNVIHHPLATNAPPRALRRQNHLRRGPVLETSLPESRHKNIAILRV